MNRLPSVTVVVTVKDRRERMMRCIDAVFAQDYPDYDFVVIDNDSRDGSAEACRARAVDAPIAMRVEAMHGSIGAVHNAGARLATGEIIAFTDSDCMPAPGWLGAGVHPFIEDAGVGLVQGRTLPDPAVPLGDWPATISVPEFSGRYEGCNLFIRRSAFEQSPGFLESVRHFWSDTVLGDAIVRAGWRAAWAPDALVHHDVTHPGMAWHLRHRALLYGDLAAAVHAAPDLREKLLWRRLFLRPRSAALAAAVAGAAAARVHRAALLAALPYAVMRAPRAPTGAALRASAEDAIWDLAVLFAMVRGSIRHKTLVI
jgi:GT2 family glycosyltransferase